MGYSKPQIGYIQAAIASMLTLVPWLAGRLTDRWTRAERTLQLCGMGMLATAILMTVFLQSKMWFVVALFLFSLFRAPVISMLDTIALQVGDGAARSYSMLRMMGSLGFAFSATAFSYLLRPGNYHPMIPWLCGLVFLFAILNFSIGRSPNVHSVSKTAFWSGLSKNWWIWLAAMALHWTAFGPYHYGFTFLLSETSIPAIYHGWIWSLGVLAEILVFWFSGRIFLFLDYRKALLLAFFANLVRWSLTGLLPIPSVVVLCQLLHGFGFALFYAAAIQGIRQYSRGTQLASFQGLFSTVVGGLASIVGLSLAGLLHGAMAFHNVLLWMVPLQLLALILLWRFPLNLPS